MKYPYVTDVRTDTLPTGRTYHTVDGSFPSITTILGKTANNAWLQAWKDRVGEEEAARVSKEATDRGTWVHEIAEAHFNGEDVLARLHNAPTDVVQMSKSLIKLVSSGVEDIWGQEQVLWSTKYQYAGRTDMVGIWKGVPSIIDFKTSKKPKNSKAIKDYYLQCCAYAVAHNEMYGTGIKNIVIAITVEGKEGQLFEKSAIPFLPELKFRRRQFDTMQAVTDI